MQELADGKGKPANTREIQVLAQFFRVSPGYLLNGEGAVGVQSRPAFKALVAILDSFSPRKQDAVLAVLVEVVKRGLRIYNDDQPATR
ncbi:hypothetical protein D3C72_834920 [compost metagenome]